MRKISENLLYYGLLIFALTVSFTMSGQSAGVAVALTGWVLGIVTYKKFVWDRNKLILFGWFFVIVLSSLFSVNMFKSFHRVFFLLGELGLFFAVSGYNWDSKNLSRLVKIMVIFAVLESIYGIIQYFTGATFLNYAETKNIIKDMYFVHTDALRRTFGTWDHSNSLGGILGMLIPVSFFAGIYSDSVKEKCFYFISVLIILFCLALTFTRGAWFGVIFSLLILIIYKRRKLAFIPFLFLIILMLFPISRMRIIKSFNVKGEAERISIWKVAVNVIKEKPVLGSGPETFSEVFFKRLTKEEINTYPFRRKEHFHYHNLYLGLGAETGLLSLGLFLAFVVGILVSGFRNLNSVKDRFLKGALLGCIGVIIDFLIHGLVDYNLRGNTVYFFWFACGLIVSINSKYETKVKKSNSKIVEFP